MKAMMLRNWMLAAPLMIGLAACQTDRGRSTAATPPSAGGAPSAEGAPGTSSTPSKPTMSTAMAPKVTVVEARGDYRQDASGMVFPKDLGGFGRAVLLKFDPAGADMSANYRMTGAEPSPLLSVYVYPALAGGRPGGNTAARCQQHFDVVKSQVLEANPAYTLGRDHETEVHKNGWTIAGQYADYRRPGLGSRVYLFCNVGSPWVVKIRFTYPDGTDADRLIGEVLSALPWPAKAMAGGAV